MIKLDNTLQPLDADLTAIAALTTTSAGRNLLTGANAAAIRAQIGAVGTALEITTALQGAEADPTKIGVEYMPDPFEVGNVVLADPLGAALADGAISGGPGNLIYRHNGVDEGGVAYRPEPENVVRYVKEITAAMKNRQPLRSVVVGTVVSGTYVVSTFTASSVNSGSPVAVNVAVSVGDTASQIAAKIAASITANATINTAYSAISIGPFLFFQCLSGTVDATLTHATGVGDTSGVTASSMVVKTACMTLLGSFELPASYVANLSKFLWEGDSYCYGSEATGSAPYVRLVFDGNWGSIVHSTINTGTLFSHKRNAGTSMSSAVKYATPLTLKTTSGTTLAASILTADTVSTIRGTEIVAANAGTVESLLTANFNATENVLNTFQAGVPLSVSLVLVYPYEVAASQPSYIIGKSSLVKITAWP